jgi:Tfp pilus assembly protein PilN
MNHINFLETKKREFNYLIMLSIIIGLISILIIFSIIQKHRINNANKNLTFLLSKKKLIATDTKQEKNETLKFEDVINKFKTRPIWSQVLYEISNKSPKGIWFKNITGNFSNIEINGYYLSEDSLYNYTRELKKINVFKKINITETGEEKSDKITRKTFKIIILWI